jgi:hypothetical protein
VCDDPAMLLLTVALVLLSACPSPSTTASGMEGVLPVSSEGGVNGGVDHRRDERFGAWRVYL